MFPVDPIARQRKGRTALIRSCSFERDQLDSNKATNKGLVTHRPSLACGAPVVHFDVKLSSFHIVSTLGQS